MTPEDLERLQELEDLLENEYDGDMREMDEYDRGELKELRAIARDEKRQAEAIAKFDKARTVFKVTYPIIGAGNKPTGKSRTLYTLSLESAQGVGEREGEDPSIQEIDRRLLSGRFIIVGGDTFEDAACAMCGAYPDNGTWPSCPDCYVPICPRCAVHVDDGHYGYWGCSACVALEIEFYELAYGIHGKVVQP